MFRVLFRNKEEKMVKEMQLYFDFVFGGTRLPAVPTIKNYTLDSLNESEHKSQPTPCVQWRGLVLDVHPS